MSGAWFDDGEGASEFCGELLVFSIQRKQRDDDRWVVRFPVVGGQSLQVLEFTAQDLDDAKLAACIRVTDYLSRVTGDVVAAMKSRRTA